MPLVEGRRSYATLEYLTAEMGADTPADAARQLAHATVRIDRLLKASVYPVDGDGEPTEVAHQEAMRDAVVGLIRWWLDTGDESGALAVLTSASAGSISVGRARGTGKVPVEDLYGQEVLSILDNAGLLHHRPWQY